jgi:hypothetical protein
MGQENAIATLSIMVQSSGTGVFGGVWAVNVAYFMPNSPRWA